MNKLLRVVKRQRTAKKYVAKVNRPCSVFCVTTRGFFETGERKGEVNPIVIRDRDYQIFEGEFHLYQQPLRINQTAERLTL